MWQWWSLFFLLIGSIKDPRNGIWVDGAHILAPKWAHEGGYTRTEAWKNELKWEVPYIVEYLINSSSTTSEMTTTLSQDLVSKLNMTTSSYRGFHTDLQLHLTVATSTDVLPTTIDCNHDNVNHDIMLLFLLPAGAFVDEHELESRHQFHIAASAINVHTYHANSNPELMAEMVAAQVDVTVVALELIGVYHDSMSHPDNDHIDKINKEKQRCVGNETIHDVSFSIPVHLRYHRADDSTSDSGSDAQRQDRHDSGRHTYTEDTTHAKVNGMHFLLIVPITIFIHLLSNITYSIKIHVESFQSSPNSVLSMTCDA